MKKIVMLLALVLLPVLSQAAEVTRAQMENALATALAEKLAAEGVSVILDRSIPVLSGAGDVTVQDLAVDPARGGFTATLHSGDAAQEVTGRYSRQVQTLVPVRPLSPGETIAEADLDWMLVDEKALNNRTATEPEQLVDMEVRRPLKAGKLILLRDVRAPRLIRKGDMVVVQLATPALHLAMQGRAMADAGMGESVRVMNLASKKTIEGVVTGPQTVAIAPPVGAMPAGVQDVQAEIR
jgi:flagella basal body P-ring formation protein FlgA